MSTDESKTYDEIIRIQSLNYLDQIQCTKELLSNLTPKQVEDNIGEIDIIRLLLCAKQKGVGFEFKPHDPNYVEKFIAELNFEYAGNLMCSHVNDVNIAIKEFNRLRDIHFGHESIKQRYLSLAPMERLKLLSTQVSYDAFMLDDRLFVGLGDIRHVVSIIEPYFPDVTLRWWGVQDVPECYGTIYLE